MNIWFLIITMLFIVISAVMVLIILVQRPQGGGLVGAFGGAGAGGSETVFGGRVGDALTWATVVAFVLYLGVAISLNKIESAETGPVATGTPAATQPAQPGPTGQQPPPLSAQPAGEGEGGIRLRQPKPGEEMPEELRRAIEEYEQQQRRQNQDDGQ